MTTMNYFPDFTTETVTVAVPKEDKFIDTEWSTHGYVGLNVAAGDSVHTYNIQFRAQLLPLTHLSDCLRRMSDPNTHLNYLQKVHGKQQMVRASTVINVEEYINPVESALGAMSDLQKEVSVTLISAALIEMGFAKNHHSKQTFLSTTHEFSTQLVDIWRAGVGRYAVEGVELKVDGVKKMFEKNVHGGWINISSLASGLADFFREMYMVTLQRIGEIDKVQAGLAIASYALRGKLRGSPDILAHPVIAMLRNCLNYRMSGSDQVKRWVQSLHNMWAKDSKIKFNDLNTGLDIISATDRLYVLNAAYQFLNEMFEFKDVRTFAKSYHIMQVPSPDSCDRVNALVVYRRTTNESEYPVYGGARFEDAMFVHNADKRLPLVNVNDDEILNPIYNHLANLSGENYERFVDQVKAGVYAPHIVLMPGTDVPLVTNMLRGETMLTQEIDGKTTFSHDLAMVMASFATSFRFHGSSDEVSYIFDAGSGMGLRRGNDQVNDDIEIAHNRAETKNPMLLPVLVNFHELRGSDLKVKNALPPIKVDSRTMLTRIGHYLHFPEVPSIPNGEGSRAELEAYMQNGDLVVEYDSEFTQLEGKPVHRQWPMSIADHFGGAGMDIAVPREISVHSTNDKLKMFWSIMQGFSKLSDAHKDTVQRDILRMMSGLLLNYGHPSIRRSVPVKKSTLNTYNEAMEMIFHLALREARTLNKRVGRIDEEGSTILFEMAKLLSARMKVEVATAGNRTFVL